MVPFTPAELKYSLTLNLLEFIIIYFIVVFIFYTWKRTKTKELLLMTMAFVSLLLNNMITVFVNYRMLFMDIPPFEPLYSIATYFLETLGYILIASSLFSHFLKRYKKYTAYFFYGIVILLVLFLLLVQIDFADEYAKFGISPREHSIHNFSELYNIVFLFFGLFVVFKNWISEKSHTLLATLSGMGLWILAHFIFLLFPAVSTIPELLKTIAIMLLAFSFAVKKELPIKIVPAHEQVQQQMQGAKYNLKPSTVYYFREEKPEKTFECFVDQVMHGKEGLCITRSYPDEVRQHYGLSRTPIIWLTQTPTEKFKYIKPTSLVQLENVIEEFIKQSEQNIIMLDGIDYLITQNSFNEVLKFFQNLFEKIALMKSIMVLSVNHKTMDRKEFSLLVGNMEELQ